MMRQARALPNDMIIIADRRLTQWTGRVCVTEDTSATSRRPPPSTSPAAKAVLLLGRQPFGIEQLADMLLGKRLGLPALKPHSPGLDLLDV